jgi:hypothetical protein
MTLAVPPERGPNSDVQQEFDEAIARIDKAIIVIRKKTGQRKKCPTSRFPGAQRLAAQAYLQGAAAETLLPAVNGAHPPSNGADVAGEEEEEEEA